MLGDTKGSLVQLTAIDLENLTQEAPGRDLSAAYRQFPDVPVEEIERPEGLIDLLLGQDFLGYLPRVERGKEHLLLLSSQFGTGRLLSGCMGVEGNTVCYHVLTTQAAEYGKGQKTLPLDAVLVNHLQRRFPSCLEADECHWGSERASLRQGPALEYLGARVQEKGANVLLTNSQAPTEGECSGNSTFTKM